MRLSKGVKAEAAYPASTSAAPLHKTPGPLHIAVADGASAQSTPGRQSPGSQPRPPTPPFSAWPKWRLTRSARPRCETIFTYPVKAIHCIRSMFSLPEAMATSRSRSSLPMTRPALRDIHLAESNATAPLAASPRSPGRGDSERLALSRPHAIAHSRLAMRCPPGPSSAADVAAQVSSTRAVVARNEPRRQAGKGLSGRGRGPAGQSRR